MKDFRLKTEDNRRKAFIRWFAWSVHNVDCDMDDQLSESEIRTQQ
jgi:hypothetical protein